MTDSDAGTIRDWRQTMLIALDAMKERRVQVAEELFDELDELRPGWQFEVPMRGRINPARSEEKAARCIIVTMLRWATMHLVYEGPRTISKSDLARAFGFSKTTIDQDIAIGERRLLTAGKGWKDDRSEYEKKYPAADFGSVARVYWWPASLYYNETVGGFGFLEDDYDPEEERRERRRIALKSREKADWRPQPECICKFTLPNVACPIHGASEDR